MVQNNSLDAIMKILSHTPSTGPVGLTAGKQAGRQAVRRILVDLKLSTDHIVRIFTVFQL